MPFDGSIQPLMMEKVKQAVRNTVVDSKEKMTHGDVEKTVSGASGVDRKIVKLAIRDLVNLGELTYTYLFGTSFLEKSFDRPVRISRRIVIKPPDKAYQPQPGEVVVNIAAGAAFGNGAHPTTCLAMRALDSVLGDNLYTGGKAPSKGLDMGTGTGILAIALANLGVQKVIATDIDPCSLSEATHNISLNGLAEHITVTNTPLQELATFFSVIVANLACPTLTRLSAILSEKLEQGGILVISGFKETASKDLEKAYTKKGLRLIHEETNRDWVCIVLRKP